MRQNPPIRRARPNSSPSRPVCLNAARPSTRPLSSPTATGAARLLRRHLRHGYAALMAARPVRRAAASARCASQPLTGPPPRRRPSGPADADGGAHAAAVALVHRTAAALGADIAGRTCTSRSSSGPTKLAADLSMRLERGRAVVPVGQVGGGAEDGAAMRPSKTSCGRHGRDAEQARPTAGRDARPAAPGTADGVSVAAVLLVRAGRRRLRRGQTLVRQRPVARLKPPHGVRELRRSSSVPRHGALAPVGAVRGLYLPERHRGSRRCPCSCADTMVTLAAPMPRAEDRVAAAQLRRHAPPQLPPLRVEGRARRRQRPGQDDPVGAAREVDLPLAVHARAGVEGTPATSCPSQASRWFGSDRYVSSRIRTGNHLRSGCAR